MHSTTFTSLPAYEAAIGGADNGTTPADQGNGFRHLSWDGIALDGSDPGSTVVTPGHVVALSRSRAQPWGVELDPNIAVANDGFKSVNANADSPAFSPPNEWALFSSKSTDLQIVDPTSETSTPVPAVTRGLGVVFLNVTGPGTQIEYFNGQTPLGSMSAAPGPPGAPSFAGLLFDEPVVTRVVITLGSGAMFNLDGSLGATDTVAADDLVLAEPDAGQPTVTATAGVPVSTRLASFTGEATDRPSDFRATIDWGDGARSLGTIAAAPGGGFAVSGTHAYPQAGSYVAHVVVNDFAGSQLASDANVQVAPRPTVTNLACSPSPVAVSAGTTCTATITDAAGAGASTPTGVVSFSSTTPGATFAQDSGCLLGPTATAGVSSCAVAFTPGLLPPVLAHVAAVYAGDGAHGASNASATVAVHAQRCTLKALTRRLRAQGLGVLVTCDARSGVQLSVQARVGRKGRFRAFQIRFGTLRSSVTAARPTVLLVKPAAGVLPALRTAARRHQHVSLKLTLTASSHATTRTTTTRVSALRLS